jgi:hypothetical protein
MPVGETMMPVGEIMMPVGEKMMTVGENPVRASRLWLAPFFFKNTIRDRSRHANQVVTHGVRARQESKVTRPFVCHDVATTS